MTGSKNSATSEATIPKAEVRPREGLSIVWLVPLIATLIGAWLAYKTISQSGPEVTIDFETAGGLEPGKSKIMYKDVAVGTVDTIGLSKDLSTVVVTASLDREMEPHLKKGSEFWIVQPKISVTGISGLSTLVSGNFIAFQPGGGAPTKKFQGLDQAPIVYDPKTGRRFVIETDRVGSLTVGAPINFRGVEVGSVLGYGLREDNNAVLIDILVKKPHDQLVRDKTRFWDAGGIRFNLGDLINASVRVGSIESLIAGGIAFDNPQDAGPTAEVGKTFKLLEEPPREETEPKAVKGSLSLLLKAEVLGSIKAGDPVLYREFQVGKVQDVALSDDAVNVDVTILIDPGYVALVRSNTVFWNASGIKAHFGLFSGASVDVESLSALISGGVAFATPDKGGEVVKQNAVFELHDQPKDEWKDWAPYIKLPKSRQDISAAGEADDATPAASTSGEPSGDGAVGSSGDTPAESGPPMPNALALPVSGSHATASMVQSRLEDLGFEDIGEMKKQGAIFHLTARWQGRPLRLKIDANTGAIEETN